ncbi:hypothetical protein D3C72_1010610 [compost metagenome]
MRRLLGAIVDPETPAHVQVMDVDAFGRQLVNELQQLVGRFHKGIELGELGADMAIHPLDLDVGHGRRLAVDGGRLLDGDAELVLLEAGGDIGVSARIDIRVDPYRDPRLLAHAASDPVQALQLGFRLQVEAEDLFLQREAHLGLALGDAGEDHLGRIPPRRQHPGQLPAGDDVKARAQARQQVEQGQVGVGLDRVADQMGNVARSLIEGVPVALKSGARVDIQRGAVLVGELLQGKLLGLKLAVGVVVKVIQGGGSFLDYCGAASEAGLAVAGEAACGVLSVLGCAGVCSVETGCSAGGM